MTNINVHNTSNHKLLAESLGSRVVQILSDALKARGSAYLVVSGGSTPKPLFQYLSRQDIDWGKVTVTLADERCVDARNSESNAKLVKTELLTGLGSAANFISLFDGGITDSDDQITAGLKLLSLPRYDMVILGIGDDGHTASIFPQAKNRDLALDSEGHRLALLTNPETATPLRITQTFSRLINTRHLAMHFTGVKKAGLLEQIIKTPDSSKWPVSSFITQKAVPLEIFTDEFELAGVAA